MRNGSTFLGSFNWRNLNIGGLGYVTGLVHAADGTVSGCRTDVGGAYRREGSSGTWTQIVSPSSIPSAIIQNTGAVSGAMGVWELAIAPSDPAIWWMFFRNRALRSADRGVTWADTNLNGTTGLYMNANGGNQRIVSDKVVVDPSNPEVVYCGSTRDGLWRRLSGTWAQIASVPASAPASADDLDKIIIVQVDPSSSLVGSGATSRRSVVYATSEGNGLYKSTDGGDTFALMSGHPGAGASFSSKCITVDVNGKLWLCVNTGSANNVWTWNGTSWTNITYSNAITNLTVDPKNVARLVGRATNSSPIETTDSGATWKFHNPVNQTAVATSVPIIASVLEATFRDSQSGQIAVIRPHPTVAKDFVAMGLGVCYFASTWPAVGTQSLAWVEDSAGIEELVTHFARITPAGDTILCSHDKAIIRSASATAFPDASYPAATLTDGYSVDYAADNSSFLVCMIQKNGNFSGYSSDGGRTWTAFGTSYGTAAGGSIAVSNSTQIVVAPGQNNWPKYSADGGATWAYCAFAAVTRITDGTENGFGFSTTSTRRQIVCADKAVPGTFYIYNYGPSAAAATYRGIWKSTDGGANFTRVNSTTVVPSAYVGFHNVLRCVNGDLYLTSGDTGTWFTNDTGATFVKSTDGGVNWTTITGISEVMYDFGKAAPGATYPTLYMIGWVGGVYGLYRSYDGGSTIVFLDALPNYDEPYALAADPTRFGRVVVGFSGTGWMERTYDYSMRLS